jgi:hypothetical protein
VSGASAAHAKYAIESGDTAFSAPFRWLLLRATETPCVNVFGDWRIARRHVWPQGRFAPAKSPVAFGDP